MWRWRGESAVRAPEGVCRAPPLLSESCRGLGEEHYKKRGFSIQGIFLNTRREHRLERLWKRVKPESAVLYLVLFCFQKHINNILLCTHTSLCMCFWVVWLSRQCVSAPPQANITVCTSVHCIFIILGNDYLFIRLKLPSDQYRSAACSAHSDNNEPFGAIFKHWFKQCVWCTMMCITIYCSE